MGSLIERLKSIELPACPFCDSAVELCDNTENEYGWRGFRILCRTCSLVMYSETTAPSLTVKDREIYTVEGVKPEDALEDLLRRWGAKLPAALLEAET